MDPSENIATIYKLTSPYHEKAYLGSTYQKPQYRFRQHEQSFKKYKDCRQHWLSSFEIFEAGDVLFEILEQFRFNNLYEVRCREQAWFEANEGKLVNAFRALGPSPSERTKEWLSTIENKQRQSEMIKLRNQLIKENQGLHPLKLCQTSPVIKCPCGKNIRESSMGVHVRSFQHQFWKTSNETLAAIH